MPPKRRRPSDSVDALLRIDPQLLVENHGNRLPDLAAYAGALTKHVATAQKAAAAAAAAKAEQQQLARRRSLLKRHACLICEKTPKCAKGRAGCECAECECFDADSAFGVSACRECIEDPSGDLTQCGDYGDCNAVLCPTCDHHACAGVHKDAEHPCELKSACRPCSERWTGCKCGRKWCMDCETGKLSGGCNKKLVTCVTCKASLCPVEVEGWTAKRLGCDWAECTSCGEPTCRDCAASTICDGCDMDMFRDGGDLCKTCVTFYECPHCDGYDFDDY